MTEKEVTQLNENNLSIFSDSYALAFTHPLELSFDIFKLTMTRKGEEEAGRSGETICQQSCICTLVVVGKLYPRARKY